jgi:hypothetical protein
MGTNVARLSLWTFAASTTTGLKERLSILDNGNVGINNTNPASVLDVNGTTHLNGNVDLDGTLSISGGSPGAGKVLTSDASGNASWQAPDAPTCMLNVFEIAFALTYTDFTVPAGVTKVFITMCGSGGKGSTTSGGSVIDGGGGGGGGYASFYMAVTPGQVIRGKIDAGSPGFTYAVLKYGNDSVRCLNGGDGIAGLGPGKGGNTVFAYTGFTITTPIFAINGEDGAANGFNNYTLSGSSFTDYIGGNGGRSHFGFGQLGQITRVTSGGTETIKQDLSVNKGRGAGGGAITRTGGTTSGDRSGGTGFIYIYY